MNAILASERWMRRTLFVAAVASSLSVADSKAADDDVQTTNRQICEENGGTSYEDLGGGAYRCCTSDRCWDCSASGCIMECYSPECCEELGVGEVDSCIIFDPDGSWIEGGSDGHFGGLDDLLVFNIVLDPADDSTQGSIIVVGGHKGDILVDGAMSIPPNPPALEAILLQAELIIASMQDEELAALEDFDESRAEAAEAIDDVVAGDEQSAGSAPEGGAVHAGGGAAAPTPTPAEQERPLRPHRRGRARR